MQSLNVSQRRGLRDFFICFWACFLCWAYAWRFKFPGVCGNFYSPKHLTQPFLWLFIVSFVSPNWYPLSQVEDASSFAFKIFFDKCCLLCTHFCTLREFQFRQNKGNLFVLALQGTTSQITQQSEFFENEVQSALSHTRNRFWECGLMFSRPTLSLKGVDAAGVS